MSSLWKLCAVCEAMWLAAPPTVRSAVFLPLLSKRLAGATLGFECSLFAFGPLYVLDPLVAVDVGCCRHVVAKSSRWQMMCREVMHVQAGHLLAIRLTGNLSIGASSIPFRGPGSLYLASSLVGIVHSLAGLPDAAALMISCLNSSHAYIVLLRCICFIRIEYKLLFSSSYSLKDLS